MAIAKDHSDLPKGNPPVADPQYGPLLAMAWRDAYVDESDLPMAVEGVRLRASWAGRCSREIGYKVAGLPETDPPDLAAYWRFGLGTLVHERLQSVLADAYPGAEIEKITDWKRLGLSGASHVDAYLVTEERTSSSFRSPSGPGSSGQEDELGGAGARSEAYVSDPDEGPNSGRTRSTVIEIKTTNGFAYKLMVGARGPAQGPKSGALLQAALSARALDADEVVIIYLSMEGLSPREAEKIGTDDIGKFCAEWRYPISALNEMIDREVARLGRIVELVDGGELAPRHYPIEMPPSARVTDPMTGAWTLEKGGHVLEAGTLWACGYCPMQQRCAGDPS